MCMGVVSAVAPHDSALLCLARAKSCERFVRASLTHHQLRWFNRLAQHYQSPFALLRNCTRSPFALLRSPGEGAWCARPPKRVLGVNRVRERGRKQDYLREQARPDGPGHADGFAAERAAHVPGVRRRHRHLGTLEVQRMTFLLLLLAAAAKQHTT